MRLCLPALVWICAVSCTGCVGAGGAAARSGRAGSPADFTDGAWDLRVDRVWEGESLNAGSPSAPLSDGDYQGVNDGTVYRVIVADQGASVWIEPGPVRGQRTAWTDTCAVFSLGEGTFAGGRFVVWTGSGGLQAEMTIYGSGRPVVESERGALAPAP